MKFKVGDRVLLSPNSDFVSDGDKKGFNPLNVFGTITGINLDQDDINVKWDNGTYNDYYPRCLIRRIRDTKIARKVYPEYKILGNGWLEYQ